MNRFPQRFAALALLLITSVAHADVWSGIGSNWFASTSWSIGDSGPPTSTEDAFFPNDSSGIPLAVTSVQLSASTTIRGLFVTTPAMKQYTFTGSGGAVLTATARMQFNNSDGQSLNTHTVSSLGLNTPAVEVLQNSILSLNSSVVTTNSLAFDGNGFVEVNSGSSVRTNTYSFLQAAGALQVNSGGELRVEADTTLVRGTTTIDSGGELNALAGVDLEYNGTALLQLLTGYAVDNGVHLKATGGGDITGSSFIDVGNGVTGALTVTGAGSTLTSQSSVCDWGAGSVGNATITIGSSAVATVSRLNAGTANAVFVGDVSGAATLRTTSTFRMGGGTTNRTVSLTVAGGTLQTDGLATFDNLSDLNLTSGTVSFNGGATFNAGSRFDWTSGAVNLGASQTLLVDGGIIDRTSTSGFSFSGGTTTRIRNGGTFTTPSFFDLETATLDMTGGILTVGTTNGTVSDWGRNSGVTTTATIASSALATYRSGLRMSQLGGTTSATISSNARLTANGSIETGGAATSVVTLNVTGGRVDSDGSISFLRGTTTNISSGGVVEGQDVILGSSGGTTSTTVTGANSLLRARGALTVGAAGTSQLNVDSAGLVSVGGGVTIGSQGTVSLTNGASLETGVGQSVVSAGTLSVRGASITRDVTLQANSVMNVDNATVGSLTQQASANIRFALRSASDFDNLAVTGAANLAGDFVISLGSGFTPTAGMTFPVFTSGSITGSPSSFDFTAANLPSGLAWVIDFQPTSLSLGVVSVPVLAGDYNQNNIVDAADYTKYRDALGTSAVLPNDPTGGVIGVAQYNTWRNNFNQSGSMSAHAAAASVPEPASVVVLLATLLINSREATLRGVRR